MPLFTQTVTIGDTNPNRRIDSYLRDIFPGVSRKSLVRMIREGNILVNGEQVKARHFPQAGEQIQISWPEPKESEVVPMDIPLNILFEDEDLLVMNKEPGIVVHPGAGHEDNTLVNALLHHCGGQLSGVGGVTRPGIVHRLDRDTSGCLIAAKNDYTHLGLAKQFSSRTMTKIYDALVCGNQLPPEGEIVANIDRHLVHRKRMAIRPEGKGRPAHTTFRVVKKMPSASLVEAHLHTGRTHQIRVHFQFIGHPIVGDMIYGRRPNKKLIELTGYEAKRQMLHARHVTFNHPRSGKQLSFDAPLPEDFEEALEAVSNTGNGVERQ